MSRTRFYVVLAGLLILGLLCAGLDSHQWKITEYFSSLPNLIGSVGEALIIAVVLAATVDAFIKRRLGEEVAKDISPFFSAASLPAELKSELRELSVCNVYRNDLQLKYKIIPEGSSSDLILLETSIRYEAINVSGDPAKHKHSVSVQKQRQSTRPIQQIMYVKARDVAKDGDYEFVNPGMEDGLEVEQSWIRWSRELTIPSRGTAHFSATVCQILPRENFDIFVCMDPAVDVTVEVEAPNDIDVSVTFGHRRHADVLMEPSNRRPRLWEFRGGLLPYQSVVVEWRQGVQGTLPLAQARAEVNKGGAPEGAVVLNQ